MRVRLNLTVERPDAVPVAAGRTVYRVVQEGLTNARKHAPGSEVDVEVTDNGAGALSVSVETLPARDVPPPPAATAPVEFTEAAASCPPGSGTGLIGLVERVALAGGRLDHGPTAEGGYAVIATLPIPA
jgi:signal transduction histidine kinase